MKRNTRLLFTVSDIDGTDTKWSVIGGDVMYRIWLLLFILVLLLMGSWGVAAAIVVVIVWAAMAMLGWLVKHVKIPK
jgi:hypothetical protein